jgi:phage-related minor tail protein
MALDVGTLVARLEVQGMPEFDRDASKAENRFRALAQQADRSVQQTAQSTRGLGQGFTDAGRDADQAAQRVAAGQRDVRSELQRTEQTGRQAAQGMGDAFRNSMRGVGDGVQTELGQIREQAQGAGGDAGGGFLAGFGGRIAGLGAKAGPIGAALAGAAAVGLVAGKALADAVREGFEMQQERANVQASLGVDAATMRRIGDAAGKAYAANFGESVAGNLKSAEAGFDFNLIDAGSSQAEIQGLIEKASTLNTILGTETPETLRGISGLVQSGLVANIDEAFDVLTTARNRGLNAQGDLLDSLSEYSTGWKNSGLSAKTALALIDQSMQMGVDNTDRGADAIREFGRRVTEEGPAMVTALDNIGLQGEEMYAAFKRGGPDAEKAFDATFDKIRSIKDPVERNTAAMALLGDTAGDFIGAFANWDPSKAVSDFGQVEGATKRASDAIGGTATSAIEQARRQIEQASNDMKLKLADAFAPMATDLGVWVAQNQDKIVAFFATVGTAALDFTIAGAHAASMLLRVWANTTGALGTMIGNVVQGFGNMSEKLGGIIKHIPGMKSIGDTMESVGRATKTAGEGMTHAGDTATALANGIDGMIPGLERGREGLNQMGDKARSAQSGMDALAQSIVRVPDAKSIIINDNSPETRARLEALGFKVTTLPNGEVRVEAQTADAETRLQQLLQQRSMNVVVNYTDPSGNPIDRSQLGTSQRQRDAAAQRRAGGGQLVGPGTGTSDDILMWGSNGEWVIKERSAQKYGPTAMAAVNNGTAVIGYAQGGPVGYGMPPDGSGAFPDWVTALGAQYGVTPSTYAGHQTGSRNEVGYAPNPQGLNRGIDWGGSVPAMQAFAEAMFQRAPSDPAIEQIIWQNPQTGQKIGWHGRSPDTDGSYYASDYPGHQDHVHLRVSSQIGAAATGTPGQRTIPLVQNPDGTWTSTDPAWAALIKRESGGRPDVVQGIQDANSGGNEASGLFQIAKGTWAANGGTEFAPTAGQATPEQQAIVAARIFDASGGSPWGAGMAGREDEAGLRAGITTTTGSSDATAAPSSPSGPVQNVYVTGGHLDSAPSSSSSTSSAPSTIPAATKAIPKPSGPLPLVAYADGGFGAAPAAATMLDSARAWVTLAGEAGRELYLPIDGSDRSRQMWLQAGTELGMVRAHAQGGFGGYTRDTRDKLAPKNAYDWLAMGVGGAFTVASLFEPYIGMAMSKQIDLGNLTPTIDTGNNTSQALSSIASQYGDAITQQLVELVKLAREGKQIHISVDGGKQGPSTVGMMAKGM